MTEISVIVPAYNVENYLERCLDSLLDQTFQNFELILVDDGSTDRTSQICDTYADHNKVRVIHKANGGVSDARNVGLECANGRYITFVDSDDYVASTFLETLYQMITEEEGVTVSMLPGQQVLDAGKPVEAYAKKSEIVSAEEAARMMLLRKGITHSCWGKLFRRDLWTSIRFPVGHNNGEDAITFRVISKAEKVAYMNSGLYYYVQRAGSIMHQKCTEKTLSVLDIADEVTDFISFTWPKLTSDAIGLKTAIYLKNLQIILNSDYQGFPQYQTRIIAEVKRNAKTVLANKELSKKDKVKICCLLVHKNVFLKVYNCFNGDKVS